MKKILLVSLGLNVALIVFGIFFVWPTAPESAARAISSTPPTGIEPLQSPEMIVSPPPSVALDEMESKEQVAALLAAGWTEEDAKVFSLGFVIRDHMELMLMGGGNQDIEYWEAWRGPHVDWESQRKVIRMQERLWETMEGIFGPHASKCLASR